MCSPKDKTTWTLQITISLYSRIPVGFYVAPLKEEDVQVINPIWPHYREHISEIYLKKLIRLNGGFGLYRKDNDGLCSWIIKNNYGGLAILQTIEECKKKGYASIMAKYFSKHWAERGIDVFCFIMIKNTPSQRLFEKIGYEKEHGLNWILTVPKEQENVC